MPSNLPLLEWMRDNDLSNEDLANALASKRDVSPESLRQIAHGYRRASWDLAFAIEEVTGGAVTAKKIRGQGASA